MYLLEKLGGKRIKATQRESLQIYHDSRLSQSSELCVNQRAAVALCTWLEIITRLDRIIDDFMPNELPLVATEPENEGVSYDIPRDVHRYLLLYCIATPDSSQDSLCCTYLSSKAVG